MRLTEKSLSPALTTSPASSLGLPAPAMNSSLTQSVSMLELATSDINSDVAIQSDLKSVLETNIMSASLKSLSTF